MDDFNRHCIYPLQEAFKRFVQNMVAIMTILKGFVDGLKSIKSEFNLLQVDSEGEE